MGCCQVSFVISVLNEIGSVLCCWMGRVVLGPISQLRHQEVINQHIGKAPSSCDPPSAEPFCTNPCIFVSAPSHLWCHFHHLVVVGVSQSNASHHSSCLSPETGLVFYSDQLTWWFCQDETSSRWPGWLPGLGAQRSGDSAIPATTSSMVAMPMDSQSPCQHMGPVVWDLLLPDLPDRERNLSLQGGVASDAQGAPWWRGPPKWCFPFPSAWELQGQELWMNRAGEDKGCGEIMAALCQVDLNCWTKPSCSRHVSRASQGEEPEWLNIFPRPKQDKGVIWNRILHDPCTPPRLLHGAYIQITVGFCSSSCLGC